MKWAFLAVYIITASLTGGYYFNHRCTGPEQFCSFEATYAGLFWPIYWLARFGLEVTK